MDLSSTQIHGEITELLPVIAQGGLVLTPNRRLSRRLMAGVEQAIALQGQQSWQTPRILPIDAWVQQHWQRMLTQGSITAKQLLTKQQDLCLWEQCIADSPISATLLRPASAAGSAQEAYQLIRSWLINIDEHGFEFGLHEDSETWLAWYHTYCSLVNQSDYIATIDAQLAVANALADENHNEPHIVLAGFEAPTPLQLQLVNNASVELTRFRWAVQSSSVEVIPCVDKTTEITQAALWAKTKQDENPSATIAVISQDLNSTRKTVDRIFTRVFKPTAVHVASNAITDTFDMSAGTPLAETPVVAAGLLALNAGITKLDQDQWGCLLTSPYVGLETQLAERELLLAKLIGNRTKDSYLAKVRSLAERLNKKAEQAVTEQAADDKSFSHVLLSISEAQRELKRSATQNTLSYWGEYFQQQLKLWHWPGSRSPSSDEYQQITAFNEAAVSFGQLDTVLPPCNQSKALELFQRHLRSQTYHRQTASAKVQVLGGLEGSGQTFDYLWLLGMSERQWPATPNPNPFLPKALQQQMAMPNSSLEREFAYSRRLTQGYLSAAENIVVSYPAAIDDIACKLSPLVAEHSSIQLNEVELKSESIALQAVELEQIDDTHGIALEDNKTQGGTGLLQSQAACPFKAYAQYRLKVQPLDEPYSGIDPRERGIIVHRALELLWQRLNNSEALQALSVDEKTQLVQQCADQAMQALTNPTIALKLKQLEQQRLQALLTQWLDIELGRGQFTVAATEQKQEITIGEMTFAVRLDRVDTLPNNASLVIDYKTGSANVASWLDERLSEPQLPLYLQALDEEQLSQSGLAVASLKAGQLGFKGITGSELEVKGITTLDKVRNAPIADWDELIQHWRTALLQLVDEISAGLASVSPAKNACQYCGLQPLCRIDSAEVDA